MSHIEKQKEWGSRLAAYRCSGKTMSRWCREEKISYERMKYWKKRIRESGMWAEPEPITDTLSIWAQVPSTLAIGDQQSVRATGNIYIYIRDIAVEVPKGFDAGTLREVLSAVQKPW